MAGKYKLRIPRRANHCFKGGENLEPGMEVYSLLLVVEEEAKREDYCPKCWEEHFQKKEKDVTFWKGKIPSRVEKKDRSLSEDEKAIELIQELVVEESQEAVQLAFFLSLYLERKKLIQRKKELKGSHMFFIPSAGELVAVKKVQLRGISVQDLQSSLEKRLEAV